MKCLRDLALALSRVAVLLRDIALVLLRVDRGCTRPPLPDPDLDPLPPAVTLSEPKESTGSIGFALASPSK